MWGATDAISAEVIDRLVDQPVPWHRQQSTGDLITRAGVDAEASTAVLAPMPFASGVVVMVVLSAVFMLVTDIPLGLAAICLFPLLIVANLSVSRRSAPNDLTTCTPSKLSCTAALRWPISVCAALKYRSTRRW